MNTLTFEQQFNLIMNPLSNIDSKFLAPNNRPGPATPQLTFSDALKKS